MSLAPPLLIGAVVTVGVLHTIVPDHWVPIALLARRHRWLPIHTARAALTAGLGHVISTLAIALAVWFLGIAIAQHFGHLMNWLSSAALILFGGWIALSSWREVREGHEQHDEKPASSQRTALLLILGSSPMVEGIPAFFTASSYGPGLLIAMAAAFAASTMLTYLVLCVASAEWLEHLRLGPLERYGEVLSGVFIALLGIVFACIG